VIKKHPTEENPQTHDDGTLKNSQLSSYIMVKDKALLLRLGCLFLPLIVNTVPKVLVDNYGRRNKRHPY
jgi:hypothetical protein